MGSEMCIRDRIMMTDKEKEAFYKRYLLCMKLNVSQDGAVSITLG